MSGPIKYDEDICNNPFFAALQNNHKQIFEKATQSRWLICIPRAGSLTKVEVLCGEIEDHILVPGSGGGNYVTTSGKHVKVENGRIETGENFDIPQSIAVLFEEVFYNGNDESYTVMCIDRSLNTTHEEMMTVNHAKGGNMKPPSTYEECTTLLWPDSGHGKKSQEAMDKLLASFLNSYSRLQRENLRFVMDAARAQFTQAMKTSLKDISLRLKARTNPAFMDNLKIAVETYMMHYLHKKLFSSITLCTATEDSRLNKTTRNLSKLQLKDLSVKQQFCENIPRARQEVSRLNRYSTPLGKLFCIRRVVRAITKPSSRQSREGLPLTTDDFLPILMFLVVKSQIPNWHANLVYMKHFNFAKTSNADEHGYYLASIEGALEHILSGQLTDLIHSTDTIKAKRIIEINSKADELERSSSFTEQLSPTDALFQAILSGDIDMTNELLKQPSSISLTQPKLCHPLCSCENCESSQKRSRSDPRTVTVYSRDDRGYTVLHAAAIAGHANLVDILVKKGAVVNASDYMGSTPLHLASEKGLQNFMLLLLHYRADPNIRDNDGNTSLHIAAANGHEDCVKALVFYDVHGVQADIDPYNNMTDAHLYVHLLSNCVKALVFYDVHGVQADVDPCNDMGDTPLHLASKWGYEVIVNVLLENGAHIDVYNRKRETPYKLAANPLIQRLLTDYDPPVMITVPLRRKKSSSVTPPPSQTPIHPHTEAHIQHERKVARLLQAVASDDLPLLKYYLGWQEDWEGEDQLIQSHELCHPLCQCSKCAPVNTHTKIQANGIHVDSYRSSDHMTCLHTAVSNGNAALVMFLIKCHANVNYQTKKLMTPLHMAALNGHTEILKLLIEAQAKVNTREMHGNTALHFSCMKDNTVGVQYLLEAKAKPNLVNSKGSTALHEAVVNNRVALVDLLLQNGANVDVKNKYHVTPLMLSQDPIMYKKLLDHRISTTPHDFTDPVMYKKLLDHRTSTTPQDFTASATETIDPSSSTSTDISIRELFAAFEEKDLATLKTLGESIRTFDKTRGLRRMSTKESFYPIIDWQTDDVTTSQSNDKSDDVISVQSKDFFDSTESSGASSSVRDSSESNQSYVLLQNDTSKVLTKNDAGTTDYSKAKSLFYSHESSASFEWKTSNDIADVQMQAVPDWNVYIDPLTGQSKMSMSKSFSIAESASSTNNDSIQDTFDISKSNSLVDQNYDIDQGQFRTSNTKIDMTHDNSFNQLNLSTRNDIDQSKLITENNIHLAQSNYLTNNGVNVDQSKLTTNNCITSNERKLNLLPNIDKLCNTNDDIIRNQSNMMLQPNNDANTQSHLTLQCDTNISLDENHFCANSPEISFCESPFSNTETNILLRSEFEVLKYEELKIDAANHITKRQNSRPSSVPDMESEISKNNTTNYPKSVVDNAKNSTEKHNSIPKDVKLGSRKGKTVTTSNNGEYSLKSTENSKLEAAKDKKLERAGSTASNNSESSQNSRTSKRLSSDLENQESIEINIFHEMTDITCVDK